MRSAVALASRTVLADSPCNLEGLSTLILSSASQHCHRLYSPVEAADIWEAAHNLPQAGESVLTQLSSQNTRPSTLVR